MTFLPGIAVLAAAMLSPDRIQAKLNSIQATLSSHADPPPKYVVYDRNTIIAGFRWQDEDGPNGIVVAYHVTEDGRLKRLSTFKYGDSPHNLELQDATGDGRAEILVTGTAGNRTSPLEILSWDGKHLETLGETSTSGTAFVDVDGDGINEVLTRSCCMTNECGSVLSMPTVQHYHDDHLDDFAMPDLEDYIDVTKTTDEPETFERGIALRDEAPETATLQLIRKRGAGVTVVEEPGERAIPVNQPVTFASRCIRVRLTVTGPKGSQVSILVRSPRP